MSCTRLYISKDIRLDVLWLCTVSRESYHLCGEITWKPRHSGHIFSVILGLASTGEDGDDDAIASALFTFFNFYIFILIY